MARVLGRLPAEQAEAISQEQRIALAKALEPEYQGQHVIDWRSTLSVPFVHKRLYFVFLAGQDKRHISRGERQFSAWVLALLLTTMALSITATLLLCVYLAKSALGIDIFPRFSTGIWDWFLSL